MTYAVDKNVPVPEPLKKKVVMKYPLNTMEVFDSFVVSPLEETKVRQAAYSYGKRNNRKYTVRRTETGELRCWRLE